MFSNTQNINEGLVSSAQISATAQESKFQILAKSAKRALPLLASIFNWLFGETSSGDTQKAPRVQDGPRRNTQHKPEPEVVWSADLSTPSQADVIRQEQKSPKSCVVWLGSIANEIVARCAERFWPSADRTLTCKLAIKVSRGL